ncbi:sensor histidine kinase [Flavobacterium alkalisoli]|uniref:histidine kinase n=1 Tax=Flavobacterium alkalisoli TaxID=2602769 RepID=A0A5B9FRP2_9FLAO|nr:ATP-binding protein [Flavobacterium alkalisoli]QEE48398.1 sensor histidine kinase [Flavobacterium alkalisoli]
MQFSNNRSFTRGFIILASFLIVVLIVWNTYYLFQVFKDEERNKVELWAMGTKAINDPGLQDTGLELTLRVIRSNNTIPVFKTDKLDNILDNNNISPDILKDSVKLHNYFEDIKKQNEPIKIMISDSEYQYIYYGNSPLLDQLKYYPVALILIIVLFGALVFNFYRATKIATQNKLWAGMAKETAHQIGTPLSSLLGWIEIMKVDNVDETTVTEVEKDVNRLQTIADRFSKIGSEPVLEPVDIVAETEKSFEYLRSRTSNQVEFLYNGPDYPIPVMLNKELHSWTVENLVKNAVDAMKGKGSLKLIIQDIDGIVKIQVTDTGKGIPKNQYKKVFEPGFTTKKRGWGLGLSLTKRIVEEYHKGRIKVKHSEVGVGTTMQASYHKA